MKPPPRTRNKSVRNLSPNSEPPQTRRVCNWPRKELRMLLNALRRQSSSKKQSSRGGGGGSPGNVDYNLLKQDVPSRSVCEIQSVVERIQNKVISGAILQLKTRTSTEMTALAPIQLWTRLAQAVSGSFDAQLSKAFSQMWTVASTEPDTLKNCQPPQLDAAQSEPMPAQASAVVPAEQLSRSGTNASEDFTVDFEKIYNYLGGIHKPKSKCELTAMESAVFLDLVMSLPEELGFLRCQSLHRHLIQAHQNLSEAKDSERAQKELTELERQRRGSDQEPQRNDVDTAAAEQTSGSSEPVWTGLCPPLNPFMIPLELLKRR
ncbi:snRNA-activating protein complex subunit 2 isoform X2 [Vanacampus margaritifer]